MKKPGRARGNSVGDSLCAEEEFEQKPAKHTKSEFFFAENAL